MFCAGTGRPGRFGPSPHGAYRIVDHARCMDAWFDALNPTDVTLVLHDWALHCVFTGLSAAVGGLHAADDLLRNLIGGERAGPYPEIREGVEIFLVSAGGGVFLSALDSQPVVSRRKRPDFFYQQDVHEHRSG
ncbi:MAG TPA: hypothetical protein VGI45_26645 [Terracidiphilus sp.]